MWSQLLYRMIIHNVFASVYMCACFDVINKCKSLLSCKYKDGRGDSCRQLFYLSVVRDWLFSIRKILFSKESAMPTFLQYSVVSLMKAECHRMTCQCRQRGEALLWLQHICNLGPRRSGWSAPRPGRLFPGEKPIAQDGGWASGPVRTSKSRPHRDSSCEPSSL